VFGNELAGSNIECQECGSRRTILSDDVEPITCKLCGAFLDQSQALSVFKRLEGFEIDCSECGSKQAILSDDVEPITCYSCGSTLDPRQAHRPTPLAKVEKADGLETILALATIISFGLGVVGGILVVIRQAYSWLQFGRWPAISFIDALGPYIGGSSTAAWLAEPHSWLGVHRIVVFLIELPLSLWILLGGCAIGSIFLSLLERMTAERNRQW